jgi:hypothetical protein
LACSSFFFCKWDIYNIAGCLTRAIRSIVAALFAINGIYPLGDKRAIDILENASQVSKQTERKN